MTHTRTETSYFANAKQILAIRYRNDRSSYFQLTELAGSEQSSVDDDTRVRYEVPNVFPVSHIPYTYFFSLTWGASSFTISTNFGTKATIYVAPKSDWRLRTYIIDNYTNGDMRLNWKWERRRRTITRTHGTAMKNSFQVSAINHHFFRPIIDDRAIIVEFHIAM